MNTRLISIILSVSLILLTVLALYADEPAPDREKDQPPLNTPPDMPRIGGGGMGGGFGGGAGSFGGGGYGGADGRMGVYGRGTGGMGMGTGMGPARGYEGVYIPPPPAPDALISGLVKISCDPYVLEVNEQILQALLNSSFIMPEKYQKLFRVQVTSLGASRPRMYGIGASGPTPETGNLYRLEIISLPDAEPDEKPSPDLISEIARRLQVILDQEYENTLRPLKAQLDSAQQQLEPAQAQINQLLEIEREITSLAGRTDLENIKDELEDLQRNKREMQMELARMNARRDALQTQIAQLAHTTQEKIVDDPIARELTEIIRIRQAELERWEKLAGIPLAQTPPAEKESLTTPHDLPASFSDIISIGFHDVGIEQVLDYIRASAQLNMNILWGELESEADVTRDTPVTINMEDVTVAKALEHVLLNVSSGKFNPIVYDVDEEGIVTIKVREEPDDLDFNRQIAQAREALTQAKIELEKRRDEIAKNYGANDIVRWNQELAGISMTAAEKEAFLAGIGEQLEQIQSRDLLELADRLYVEVTIKMDSACETHDRIQREIMELKERVSRTLPPQVSVLGD